MRREFALEGEWEFRRSCGSISELDGTGFVPVVIPHTWNNIDGQDGGNDYYRGTCCYRKTFASPALSEDEQVFLEFEAVSSSASVYLNGKLIKTHDGGYSAFQVRIDDYLKHDAGEENELLVFADNSINGRVYPQTADFTFYGGIYRPVRLICVSSANFGFGKHGGCGVKLTPSVLSGNRGLLKAEAWVCGDYDEVRFIVLDGERTVCSFSGSDGEAEIEDIRLWDGVKDPFLYTVKAQVVCADQVTDELSFSIGFRSIRIDAEKGFLLNGRSYPLRGVSRHQDREGVGNALTDAMHEEDLAIIMECGANSIRLAHYQHSRYFYDLCDRAGILCWAEIPYITKHMNGGVENTLFQMSELIEQCYNHTCIFCWSISNEITAGGNGSEVYENNRKLYNLCHLKDCSRPVAMAHAFMLPIEDRMVTLPDIAGYNLYYGWYLGEMEGNGNFLDSCHRAHPDLPLGLTEFGCDANTQFQTSDPVKGDYSEQYQALFHEFMCREIAKRPYLWGTFIWNMFDFAADARDEGGTKGRNSKGLVSFDRKTRKDSFYAVKAWYSSDPFVHICGRRYVNRCEDITTVKVYSNRKSVELFCNGTSLGRQEGEHTFVFEVELGPFRAGSDCFRLEAVSGNLRDSIEIRRVEFPDQSYISSSSDVKNWAAELDLPVIEGFYSIKDTIGEIRRTEEGKALFERILSMRSAEKEGVAAEVEMTESMMDMTMKDVQLSEMLRRSGVASDKVVEINRILNGIRKV